MQNMYKPDVVYPPGEILREFLVERGMSIFALAEISGMTRAEISSILVGNTVINEEIASRLERAFGTAAGFWLKLDSCYRDSL